MRAMVGERSEEGFAALTLEGNARGGLEAVFVPEAGMICCSLKHRGEELLGQRDGLRAYVDHYSTMGIPFLHPGRTGSPATASSWLAAGSTSPSPGCR